MGAAELIDDLTVGSVEMELSGELVTGDGIGAVAVLPALFIGQDADGHAVRKSRVLRREGLMGWTPPSAASMCQS